VRGDRAAAAIEEIWCEKIRGCAFRGRESSSMSAMPGGLNRSAQHSNLLAEMECGHEAATSHLLFYGSAD